MKADLIVISAIKSYLTDDLLGKGYTGHCYVASEVYYHVIGMNHGFKPYQMKVNGVSHWWLRCGSEIVDITADQFDHEINYWHEDARCRGFLTKGMSKRASILYDRVMRSLGRNYW